MSKRRFNASLRNRIIKVIMLRNSKLLNIIIVMLNF